MHRCRAPSAPELNQLTHVLLCLSLDKNLKYYAYNTVTNNYIFQGSEVKNFQHCDDASAAQQRLSFSASVKAFSHPHSNQMLSSSQLASIVYHIISSRLSHNIM